MAILKPSLAILDETDSGLDIDALNTVFNNLELMRKENPKLTILLITHYYKVFKLLKPDKVHILINGHIVKDGPSSILKNIEKHGYKDYEKNK
jgi:Fe-S cluster assembly ATP-binding protein